MRDKEMPSTGERAQAYDDGRLARDAGRANGACPIGDKRRKLRVLRSHWLAGWHDKDMELK